MNARQYSTSTLTRPPSEADYDDCIEKMEECQKRGNCDPIDKKAIDFLIFRAEQLKAPPSLTTYDDFVQCINDVSAALDIDSLPCPDDADGERFLRECSQEGKNLLVGSVVGDCFNSISVPNSVLDEIEKHLKLNELFPEALSALRNLRNRSPLDSLDDASYPEGAEAIRNNISSQAFNTLKLAQFIYKRSDFVHDLLTGKFGYTCEFVGNVRAYPDGVCLAYKEKGEAELDVIVMFRGSQFNYTSDWWSVPFGGNFYVFPFPTCSDGIDAPWHYGHSIKYDFLHRELSRKMEDINPQKKKLNLTFLGHSQGGSLATLSAYKFESSKDSYNIVSIKLYTFASLKTLKCDRSRADEIYGASGIRHTRIENVQDVAVYVPGPYFSHFGSSSVQLDSKQDGIFKIAFNHDLATYFALLEASLPTNVTGSIIDLDLQAGEDRHEFEESAFSRIFCHVLF